MSGEQPTFAPDLLTVQLVNLIVAIKRPEQAVAGRLAGDEIQGAA
jgi:hypothetical protein